MKRKKLGLGSSVATVVGLIVATSCLVSLGSGFGMGGASFVIPLAVAFVLNVFVAMSFAELNAVMPNVTGGLSQYALAAFGPGISIISTMAAYVICITLAASVEAAMFGLILNMLFGFNATLCSLLLVAVILAVNILGIKSYALIQNLTVVFLLGSMAVMGIIAFFNLSPMPTISAAEMETPSVTGLGNVIGLAAIGFWLFIGVEFIIPIAGDLKNPKRDVPLSMILGLAVLFVLQAVLGLGMTHYTPLSTLAGNMPHMEFAEDLVGSGGLYWMGAVTVLAGISTLNTVLSSCSRIVCGMAQGGLLPSVFSKENKRSAPVAALVTLSAIVIIILATGISSTNDIQILILSASCFWLVSYIVTHLSVLVLRKKYPDRPRSFKVKLFFLPQIVGIVGCVYMIWNIYPAGDTKALIFKIFGIIGAILVVYSVLWVKFAMKKKFFAAEDIDAIIELDRKLNEGHATSEELGKAIPSGVRAAAAE